MADTEYDTSVHVVDYIVVIVTLLAIFLLGLWSSRRANRSNTQGYFLAGRTMSWWLVGLSLYVSNIGSGTFIGVSGSASVEGIAVVFYEFSGTSCAALLGFVFVPVYIASGCYTMPDYLQKRYGGQRIRAYVAVTQLLLMMFCYIAGEMYAGALIIQVTLGWNVYASVIALLVLTAIYTVAGGLTAVMHTDALMAAIILVGAFILMVINIIACVDPDVCYEACGSYNGCSDVAYPYLILTLMPTFLKGLMLAAMLAGVMSSFTSIFNSASSIFTIDIWKTMRPKCSNKEEMIVGRVFTIILVCLSIFWLPLIEAFGAGQLFVYLQSIASYLSPPLLAAFILAIGWERANEPGTFWASMIGLVLGVARLIADFIFPSPGCDEEDTRPPVIANFHYLHYAIFLFLVVFIFIIIFSLLTKPQPKDELIGLTWWTRHRAAERIAKEEAQAASKKENFGDASKEDLSLEPSKFIDNETLERKEDDVEEYRIGSDDDISQGENDNNSLEEAMQTSCCTTVKRGLGSWCCGATEISDEAQIAEEREHDIEVMTLSEDPKWKKIIEVNCAIMLVVGAFVWGFYA
ncbi:sodium/glucose cotransporter 4-like [Saccoglossus kowalevskii]|uniref:Sodium/glucose cotransporter 4-like n=1 Tax=Saccoglossus kowalevskii TaxID=10224 RepID=A0ABM0GSU1_SACKO|nr:PREDICTED: sodium/glucose cotransporter 4-like [Saccoglossus kowalevskii]